jgi:2-polyprenyl-3-methyl-5-hydroxy-6-metoxy-1,4-benzoquinol methylase
VRADHPPEPSTDTENYANRLKRLGGVWWKRILPVQAPYGWHIRRLHLGRTLDVGCGAGRNLKHLRGLGIGVDHNRHLVEAARGRGLEAYTPQEFRSSPRTTPKSYDSLLFAHVLEHMTGAEAKALVDAYLPFIRPGGRLVVFTPQERGFAADPTHVEFLDFERVQSLCSEAGLEVERSYSFPLPRWAGRLFPYNEFVVIARLPARR